MTSTSNCTLIFFTILLLATTIDATNITKILDKYKQFKIFNDLLSQTKLTAVINNHKMSTILVVDNSGMRSILTEPQAQSKNILATHVILEYYDPTRLHALSHNSTKLTTMHGFLNVTQLSNGDITFRSANEGAPCSSKMIKPVVIRPNEISVIQISEPIIMITHGLTQSYYNKSIRRLQSMGDETPQPSQSPKYDEEGSAQEGPTQAPLGHDNVGSTQAPETYDSESPTQSPIGDDYVGSTQAPETYDPEGPTTEVPAQPREGLIQSPDSEPNFDLGQSHGPSPRSPAPGPDAEFDDEISPSMSPNNAMGPAPASSPGPAGEGDADISAPAHLKSAASGVGGFATVVVTVVGLVVMAAVL